ncbi:MAG TPA: macro domain-containing protein [Chthonomonadaceae bacterium]|nr:macro domain-containing protein [Chthonomonadaceae bacterium]
MIRVLIGDLFESNAQTLVNTVNTVGIMGKGIALEFKMRFPNMFEDYAARCAAGEVKLGQPYLYRPLLPPWILNFPTKAHWRAVSRLSDIVAGLEYLERHYQAWGITSLAVPALGCSNGQLEWRIVGPTLFKHLRRLDIPVELYAPFGTPAEQLEMSFLAREVDLRSALRDTGEATRIQPAWVALIEILARVVREPYHWTVGRTTLQKMTYFATEAGLPTGLQYRRSSYGPFTEDLKPAITRLVNNGLLREEQSGPMFAVVPGMTYQDAAKNYRGDLREWEPIIAKVADLFLRMNTHRAEVAATVHFAAQELAQRQSAEVTERAILEAVKQWKQRRKPPLEEVEIAQAIRDLNLLGWISARPSADLPLPQGDLMEV